jgi:hypothetical protein
MKRSVAIGVLAAALALDARAAAPELERAQTLFAENRWPQVREVLAPAPAALAAQERALAQLLVGRSLAREAEFYAAARTFADEVGLDYLRALAESDPAAKLQPPPAVALFRGLYELDAERLEQAEGSLRKASGDARLPAPWRARAKLRRAAALQQLGRAEGTRALGADRTVEGRYWRSVGGLAAGEAPAAAAESGIERLLAACALFREGKASEAQALLDRAELDAPALELGSEKDKVLRFYDPLTLAALERARWEQAALALEPLAAQLDAPRARLATFYAAWSQYRIGRRDAARARIAPLAVPPDVDSLGTRARILEIALAPDVRHRSASELGALWQRSQADVESVLLWAELAPREWPGTAPLAQALPPRLEELASAPLDRASGGRWGLVQLRAGADPVALLARLSKLRESASKNRIERNDPLLLLALAVASYRSAAYAQALETIFALAQAYPGLRGLHWNLQGVYAARQTAGGEARISP